jgi:hypothetical protein
MSNAGSPRARERIRWRSYGHDLVQELQQAEYYPLRAAVSASRRAADQDRDIGRKLMTPVETKHIYLNVDATDTA